MCLMVQANTLGKDPWNIFDRLHKKNYSSQFEISYFDDANNKYDYQEGSVFWFNDKTSKIEVEKPLAHTLWFKDKKITDYIPDLNQVILSDVNANTTNIIFDFLLASKQDLQLSYNIKLNNKVITLTPKNKSLVASIQIYLDSKMTPYKLTFSDKLNYRSVVTLSKGKDIKQSLINKIEYPNTAEVLNYARHSNI